MNDSEPIFTQNASSILSKVYNADVQREEFAKTGFWKPILREISERGDEQREIAEEFLSLLRRYKKNEAFGPPVKPFSILTDQNRFSAFADKLSYFDLSFLWLNPYFKADRKFAKAFSEEFPRYPQDAVDYAFANPSPTTAFSALSAFGTGLTDVDRSELDVFLKTAIASLPKEAHYGELMKHMIDVLPKDRQAAEIIASTIGVSAFEHPELTAIFRKTYSDVADVESLRPIAHIPACSVSRKIGVRFQPDPTHLTCRCGFQTENDSSGFWMRLAEAIIDVMKHNFDVEFVNESKRSPLVHISPIEAWFDDEDTASAAESFFSWIMNSQSVPIAVAYLEAGAMFKDDYDFRLDSAFETWNLDRKCSSKTVSGIKSKI